MKGVQCYELFGGIALKKSCFFCIKLVTTIGFFAFFRTLVRLLLCFVIKLIGRCRSFGKFAVKIILQINASNK